MRKEIKVSDISKHPDQQMLEIDPKDLMVLPYPYDKHDSRIKPLEQRQRDKYECSLDGVVSLAIPKPQSKAEEDRLVQRFIDGLKKLLTTDDNWTALRILTLSLDYCARCKTCSEACHIFQASGEQEIYRPTYRSEVLRRIIKRYVGGGNKFSNWFAGADIELNWTTIARLAESAWRCNVCRRCASTCPLGIDNGILTREIRKLCSQALEIAPEEMHRLGSVLQMKVGSSTGMSPKAFKNIVQFMEEDIEEKTGRKLKIPVDKVGADILLIHNAGEFISWPENPEAFSIIFDAVGLDYTLSSEPVGYDNVNYGLFYDDVQALRLGGKHAAAAKTLKVKKIVVGECGHAHRGLIMPRGALIGIPRESCFPIFDDIVRRGLLKLDPKRNNFPVTYHDPCNLARLMGIVEPPRRVLRKLCPQFREMEPRGMENYCCGGGSGWAVMQSMNHPDWRVSIAGRMKMKQTLDAFQDVIDPKIRKYVCAPCSNCKGQYRDLQDYYHLEEKCNIVYTGVVEFMVNAMVDLKPFLE